MCFFAILGVVPKERIVGQEMIACHICGRETMQQIVEARHWFTFFFVPLFPVSGKRVYRRCTTCGLLTDERAV